MKFFFNIIIIFTAFFCNNKANQKASIVKTEFEEVKNDDYELYKPAKNIKAVLILFGGYPEKIEDIKREFKILNQAKNNNISVLYMNYNQKLWLEQNEKLKLAKQLQTIFKQNKLPTNNIYIGGFSSGGNVSLLISDFVTEQNLNIAPKGVFIVDSPIDLAALYFSSEKNIKINFSEISVLESTWIIETLGKQFGNPNSDISAYQKYAVFTSKTKNISNIKNLKTTKIRLYTEPDSLWWKKNRMEDYNQMNAFYIKDLSEKLNASEFKSVEYIATHNKGYRANGKRHPHSWSIVAINDLLDWMLKH